MKKLIMLFVLFALCLPAYADPNDSGDILVYKISGKVKGNVNNGITYVRGRVPFRGYLVIQYDFADDVMVGSELVVYGRDDDGEGTRTGNLRIDRMFWNSLYSIYRY